MKNLPLIKYFALLPLFVLVLWALAWGAADVCFKQALRYEESWKLAGEVSQFSQWENALAWLIWAQRLNPKNPDYPEMLGRLAIWRFFIPKERMANISEVQTIVWQGAVALRESLVMRPTWPFAWASLVQLKSLGYQIDDEFRLAWDKSLRFGDWEVEVQATLLEAGLTHWSVLEPQLQQQTLGVLINMLSKPLSELTALAIIDRLAVWPLVCSQLTDPIVLTAAAQRHCAIHQAIK